MKKLLFLVIFICLFFIGCGGEGIDSTSLTTDDPVYEEPIPEEPIPEEPIPEEPIPEDPIPEDPPLLMTDLLGMYQLTSFEIYDSEGSIFTQDHAITWRGNLTISYTIFGNLSISLRIDQEGTSIFYHLLEVTDDQLLIENEAINDGEPYWADIVYDRYTEEFEITLLENETMYVLRWIKI